MKRRANGEGHIRQRRDGRWEARVPDGRGGTRSVYGKTQREVIARARELRAAPVTAREPLVAVLNRWLEVQVKRRRRVKTYDTYEALVRHQVAPHLGSVPVGDLEPQRVAAWLVALEDAGLAPNTIAAARSCLVTALAWAQRQRIVAENVARLVEGVSVPARVFVPLTPPELRALVTAIGTTRYAGPLLSCLYLGCRIGEACGLTWHDVNLDAGAVQLRRQLQEQKGRGLVLVDLKTPKSRRALAVPRGLLALMAERGQREAEERTRAGVKWQRQYDDWGLVWRTPEGGACRPDRARRTLAALARQIGRPDITPHALRHQHASLLFAAGLRTKEVQEQLGHSTQATTADIYVHLLPQTAQRVAGIVEEWLGSTGEN